MIIGVDVDEVLAQLHDPWSAWILERYGVTAEWSSWHIDKTTGLGGKVFSFIAPEIYTNGTVEPFPMAHLALTMLREAGLARTEIDKLLVDNPRKVLAR